MHDYQQLLWNSLPELTLAIGAFVIMGADLMFLRHKEPLVRLRAAGTLTLVGLMLAALLSRYCTSDTGFIPLYDGMMAANMLSAFFKLVIILLAALVVIISMEHEFTKHVGEYFAVLLFGTVGMMLLVSAEELIMIFVALELTSISLYILTAFHKGSLRSAEAALKYFMFGALASAFLLFGLSWIYGMTGETSLTGIAVKIESLLAANNHEPNMMLLIGLIFAIVGFGFKIAVVPFHLWAPDAYEGAPTPVTAFIATASKVASFVVFAKFLIIGFAAMGGQAFANDFVVGWTPVLATLAVLSMIVGNLAAIVQKNIKRMLAYSSIAHAGYILLGVIGAAGVSKDAQETGFASVFYYIVIYGLTNLGAFGIVHALAHRVGGDDLEHFNGMSRRAPFLSLLLLVFVLSLTGVPPLSGFFAKFYVFAAAFQADPRNLGLMWLVWIAVITSAVSLYYYMVLLKHVFVLPPNDETRLEASAPLRAAMAVTCLAVVLLGIFPSALLEPLTNFLKFLPL